MSEQQFVELRAVAGKVSRETFDKLKAFEAEFRKWNKGINPVAPSTLDNLWSRHILDSAQLLSIAGDANRWVDLGTGGGFPGAVVALLLAERNSACIHLVESNRKKAAFLQSTLGRLGAPARVLPLRIEEAAQAIGLADVVTARALAPLPALLELAEPWFKTGAKALFHKGKEFRTELANCRDGWNLDLLEHRSLVDGDGVILEIRNVSRAR